MPRKLLITGGAGFIGSNFIHYWLKNHPEDQVTNLDALTYSGNLENLKSVENNPRYKFVKGTITDPSLVNQVMDGVDVVVHFAAETHVDRSILEPAVFLQTNVIGTQVLLEAAIKHRVKLFHHISTDEVFGTLELGSSNKFSESTAYAPRSPYSASKAASDHLVRAYGETYGLPFTLTNCSNNYGEYQYPEKLFGLTITNILEGKNVPIYGDGLQVRDWLYVQDHCRGIELVLEQGKVGETYLIGGLTEDVSNLEVVKLILSIMGESEEKIEFVKDRAGHDRRYSVNWSKINRELGWKPEVTLEEGIERTVRWYRNNESWWKPLKEASREFFEKNYQPAA